MVNKKTVNRFADVTVFDAGDVYTAGLNYELIPFMSEIYNLGKPEYYVVAVAKEEDPSTEITYLKGTFTLKGTSYYKSKDNTKVIFEHRLNLQQVKW